MIQSEGAGSLIYGMTRWREIVKLWPGSFNIPCSDTILLFFELIDGGTIRRIVIISGIRFTAGSSGTVAVARSGMFVLPVHPYQHPAG
jgi:hypothetical protein